MASHSSGVSAHLSRGARPVVEEMADVTPGVAFDLSVNLESRAFIGSILDADVSSRHALTLDGNARKQSLDANQEEFGRHRPTRKQLLPVSVVLQAFGGDAGRR